MSYFDHVRCHSCKAMLDPESLGGSGGRGMQCPRCGVALSLTDLFGVAAAFSEEEEGPVSLDDLVPASRPRPAEAPPPAPAPAPAAKPAARRAPPAGSGGGGGGALVHRPAPSDDGDSGGDRGGGGKGKGGALEAMRAMKKKR